MDMHQPHNQPQPSTALSWLTTGVVAFLCSVLGLASAHFVEPFAALFQGLGVELPLPTRFMLATYMWFLPLLFTALAAFVILKEFAARELRRRFLLTGRVFLAALIAAGLVIFVLYLPLLTLSAKLVKAK
jgi:hypothetical protein